jgi:Malonyl-CoA decarboxylase C-terminal domain
LWENYTGILRRDYYPNSERSFSGGVQKTLRKKSHNLFPEGKGGDRYPLIYVKQLERPLVEITHYYLTNEKNPRGKPLNPVANFHLGNGATVSRKHINFLGNRSLKGLEESYGLMGNYVYSQSWFQQIRKSFQFLLKIEGGFTIAP